MYIQLNIYRHLCRLSIHLVTTITTIFFIFLSKLIFFFNFHFSSFFFFNKYVEDTPFKSYPI